jgi:predicted hydrocarbon binding protein
MSEDKAQEQEAKDTAQAPEPQAEEAKPQATVAEPQAEEAKPKAEEAQAQTEEPKPKVEVAQAQTEEAKPKAEEAQPVAAAAAPQPEAKAQEASEAEPAYFYPNKWARIILTSAEEVMGRQGVSAMLNMAKMPKYIDNYPPDNMKKEFSFHDVGHLQQAIWDMYGNRGARVFAVRAGEQAFSSGLSQFKSVSAVAQVAMRVSTLEGKVKMGLDFFSKFFNTVSDQVVEIDEDDKHWIWRITRCPVCWGRKGDEAVCHLAIGVLQAALAWATEGKKFRLMETECMAKGDKHCVIRIEKVPVE